MTTTQRLTLRTSEVRSRLNEIAGLEGNAFTDEIRQESDTLAGEYRDLETKLRAATIAESADERRAADTTGEGAEIRQLQSRAELRRALHRVMNGNAIDGAERELAEARGITELNAIPWDLVAPMAARSEHRADAVTSDTADIEGTSQANIISRVFAQSATMALGVSMEQVGVGEKVYPVISGGAAAEFVAADGAKEAEAMTFEPVTLAPKRLQARYLVRREDLARVIGIEEAQRRDLSMTLANTLDAQTLAGPGTGAKLAGFLATAANGGLAAATADSDVITFATAAQKHASGVDGKYAASERAISVVCGHDTYGVLAGSFVTGESTSATAYAMKMLREFRASANIPARASNKTQEAILARMGAGDGMQNSVCPVWEGLTIIRDEVTQAAKGQIALTAVALYSFRILRAAAYKRLSYKLAA